MIQGLKQTLAFGPSSKFMTNTRKRKLDEYLEPHQLISNSMRAKRYQKL